MKKGLILALTMVALVAMVLPVSAIAPIIEQLPSVIIGDNGDVSGSGASAQHLYRYTNIMNIATSAKVTWGNVDLGFGDAQKHAYYMSSDANVKAYTASAAVTQVSPADIAAIQTSGTKPATGREITGSNFFWLSLANNMSGATSVYTATPATNGLTAAQFTPSAAPAAFTLVLADGDFPTTAVAQSDFSVYTVAGSDDGFSGLAVQVYTAGFATGSDGWVWKNNTDPTLNNANHGTTAGSLTASLASNTSKPSFGTWTTGDGTNPKTMVPVVGATGNIFRGTFTISSTAANADNTPGYRVFYQSEAFTHLGGVSLNSMQSIVGQVFAPSTAGTKDVVVYWAPPFTLTEYSDTGKLATVQTGKDFRAYFLAFDLVGYEASDTGVLGLDNVNIEMIARPDASSSVISWGTGGTPFNSTLTTAGWSANTSGLGVGIGAGTANVSLANTITMQATAATTGIVSVGPFANATSLPAWTSDQLIRTNVTMASSNVNAAPTFRVLTLAVTSAGAVRAFTWVDAFTGDTAKGLYAPAGNTAPAAPATAGSNIECYLYTHVSNGGVLEPYVDCYTIGPVLHSGSGTSWPAETATLTMSKFQYELCATK